jgi:hypothetical protein
MNELKNIICNNFRQTIEDEDLEIVFKAFCLFFVPTDTEAVGRSIPFVFDRFYPNLIHMLCTPMGGSVTFTDKTKKGTKRKEDVKPKAKAQGSKKARVAHAKQNKQNAKTSNPVTDFIKNIELEPAPSLQCDILLDVEGHEPDDEVATPVGDASVSRTREKLFLDDLVSCVKEVFAKIASGEGTTQLKVDEIRTLKSLIYSVGLEFMCTKTIAEINGTKNKPYEKWSALRKELQIIAAKHLDGAFETDSTCCQQFLSDLGEDTPTSESISDPVKTAIEQLDGMLTSDVLKGIGAFLSENKIISSQPLKETRHPAFRFANDMVHDAITDIIYGDRGEGLVTGLVADQELPFNSIVKLDLIQMILSISVYLSVAHTAAHSNVWFKQAIYKPT